MLNNKELNAVDAYCKKYRISNRSKFMREAIIAEVLKRFEDDHPTLFETKPNLYSQISNYRHLS